MATVKDNRYMQFNVNGQDCAVPLLTVKEVIRLPEVTQVPDMPPSVVGMVNLRGQILALFDARKLIKNQPKVNQEGEVVMVVDQVGINVGMIVNEVTRVIRVDDNMIKPAPVKKDDPANKYIKSVIQDDQNLILVLDLVRLLGLDSYASSMEEAA